jgi:hypothetical protein
MDVEERVSLLLDMPGGGTQRRAPRIVRLATFVAVAYQPGLLLSADAYAAL